MARIVHVANFFGPRSGGLRTMMLRLAEGYRCAGHDAHLVVPEYPQGWLHDTETPIHTLGSRAIPGSGGYRVITSAQSIHDLLMVLQPDILELSDRTTLVSAARWARQEGVPATLFAHERIDGVLSAFAPFLPGTSIANVLNQRISRLVDRVVATTEFAAEEFLRIGIRPTTVPLGVDTELFQPPLRKPSQGPVQLVMCSRLSREKEPEFVVTLMREATIRGRDWHLHVLGDGPLISRLREASAGLPITYYGFLSDRTAVATALSAADACLAPGPIETFGLAALEALACGTPVVCNAASALPEVIGMAGAALPLDTSLWISAIDKIAHPANNDLRERARMRALEFPWAATVDRMLSLHGLGRQSPGVKSFAHQRVA